ncbi:hypothetical protein P153DRAFT_71626 [Dothidotthia symphoricarpi CBS 119687]|uniref:Uncharacterized protein n=1 Tax=Dothidotthia symphoricarpi CBS 119687 TaxID=1392245 RepID=A0A6A6A5N5_9PLEO|nr:uncharacterized protein P153DRAFT_71626 [Dothidotthia symphoricarpi CBS 119687]KAF2126856.1 hypothetical protein P153DRAFT_71626 [Dothidotthia symphoricarpi CBS 119687]
MITNDYVCISMSLTIFNAVLLVVRRGGQGSVVMFWRACFEIINDIYTRKASSSHATFSVWGCPYLYCRGYWIGDDSVDIWVMDDDGHKVAFFFYYSRSIDGCQCAELILLTGRWKKPRARVWSHSS